MFVGLDSDIDGMVHLSDLSWDQPGEEAIRAYEKRSGGQGAGARRRHREGTRQPGHQAAQRRSDREGRSAQEEQRRHRHRHRSQ
ncbi:MAG: hypothetical protein WDM89_09875 [Rhizomicrobium sp.]